MATPSNTAMLASAQTVVDKAKAVQAWLDANPVAQVSGYASAAAISERNAKQSEQNAAISAAQVAGGGIAVVDFEGANNATSYTDGQGRVWAGAGGAALTTANPIAGSSSLNIPAGGYFETASNAAAFDFGAADFKLTFKIKITGAASDYVVPFELRKADGQYTAQAFFQPSGSGVWWSCAAGDIGTGGIGAYGDGAAHTYEYRRVAGVGRVLWDGVEVASGPDASTYAGCTAVRFGSPGNPCAMLIDALAANKL